MGGGPVSHPTTGEQFKGDKTAADAARLFKIHPATVSRLLARTPQPSARKAKHAK
jgi:hypothetical protein